MDPHDGLFLELASDARSEVVEAKARLDAIIARPDALADANATQKAQG